jgi:hypothetical protein
MICPDCGGERRPDGGCNLCELFAEGLAYAGVEANRHNKPKTLLGLKVHPAQRAEAAAFDRLHGVPTDYTKDGYPLVTSRAHQKKLRQLHNAVNLDGGYGD